MKVWRYFGIIASFRCNIWLHSSKEYSKLHLTVYERQSKCLEEIWINLEVVLSALHGIWWKSRDSFPAHSAGQMKRVRDLQECRIGWMDRRLWHRIKWSGFCCNNTGQSTSVNLKIIGHEVAVITFQIRFNSPGSTEKDHVRAWSDRLRPDFVLLRDACPV
jgi:hypothetical protein